MNTALTVAGSDSGGGAGIQADLKTFSAFGVFGTSAVTAVTAQNTVGVRRWQALAPDLVADQIDAVLEDIGADAVKTGMLANAEIVTVVAERLRRFEVENLVVDPVMIAKSGDALLEPAAQEALKAELLPLAAVITPNLPEAAALLGVERVGAEDMGRAGQELLALGPKAVLVKGGHLEGDIARDALVCAGRDPVILDVPRAAVGQAHGTGCALSSAIAAGLACGLDLEAAVAQAKEFINVALAHALAIGKGHRALDHFAWRRARSGAL